MADTTFDPMGDLDAHLVGDPTGQLAGDLAYCQVVATKPERQ